MGASAIQGTIIRKDNLLLLIFGICIIFIELKLKEKINKFYTFFFINIISIFAILNHESYGFWALPILTILLSITEIKYRNSLLSRISSGLYFLSPSILIFILCCLFKGNQEQVNIIHLSWRKFYPLLPSPGNEIFLPRPTGTLSSLAWSLKDGIQLSLSTFNQFSRFIWIPGAWLITILISGIYFIKSKSKGELAKLKCFILVSNFFIFTSLFIVGCDFGRWIYLWTISSAMVVSFIKRNNQIDLSRHPIYKIYEPISKFTFNIPNIYNLPISPFFLLIFGMPGCCWSIFRYIQSTPIGYLTLCNSVYCPLKDILQ